jgi:hypothetical protein
MEIGLALVDWLALVRALRHRTDPHRVRVSRLAGDSRLVLARAMLARRSTL